MIFSIMPVTIFLNQIFLLVWTAFMWNCLFDITCRQECKMLQIILKITQAVCQSYFFTPTLSLLVTPLHFQNDRTLIALLGRSILLKHKSSQSECHNPSRGLWKNSVGGHKCNWDISFFNFIFSLEDLQVNAIFSIKKTFIVFLNFTWVLDKKKKKNL